MTGRKLRKIGERIVTVHRITSQVLKGPGLLVLSILDHSPNKHYYA